LASAAGKLVTGDDGGVVKLYKFPCLEKDVSFTLYKKLNL
jgi:hypothetical protein